MNNLPSLFFIGSDFQIYQEVIKNPVAWATFSNDLNKTGWLILKISTSQEYNDLIQYEAAGYLEGYLTQEYIYDAYYNFVHALLNGKENLSEKAKEFVLNQLDWINQEIEKNKNDLYWNLVEGLIIQLKGMYKGYKDRVDKKKKPDQNLDFFNFYYLTNMGDLQDIIPAFDCKIKPDNFRECSGFIKLTQNELYTSHNTHNIYSLMLRIFKTYHFNLHNKLVKTKTMSFSARPGDLESKDDYYVLSSNHVVIESSLSNYNQSLYSSLKSNCLPTWIRVNLSNRIAENSYHWTEIFTLNNSGTHNNQWCIVDYNKYWDYKSKNVPKEKWTNIVWLIEQFFQIIEREDITQKYLIKDGYFATYNHPYFRNIFDIGKYLENNPLDPRKEIFEKNAYSVENVEDVKNLILMTKNEQSDLSKSIAPRYDLLQKNPWAFGAIDGKVIDGDLLKKRKNWLYSSPPHHDLPAFEFKNFPEVPHQGIPDIMNFEWCLEDINEI